MLQVHCKYLIANQSNINSSNHRSFQPPGSSIGALNADFTGLEMCRSRFAIRHPSRLTFPSSAGASYHVAYRLACAGLQLLGNLEDKEDITKFDAFMIAPEPRIRDELRTLIVCNAVSERRWSEESTILTTTTAVFSAQQGIILIQCGLAFSVAAYHFC